MRKSSLRDGDWLRLQACVAINLGLLAVEAGMRPGSDVVGEHSPDKSRRYHMPGGEPPRMWNMQWVWALHPQFSKWQSIICSKVLTSAGTELGIGRNCFGSKAGKTGGGGWVLDGLVYLRTKTGWFHLRDSIWWCRDRWSSTGRRRNRWRHRTVKTGQTGLGADGAAAMQAQSIWLVYGATVTLNFLRKSMPRMGPATVACKNCEENSLPWN